MNEDALILAYLAGVVDSDGSITIASDTWRTRKFARTPTFSEHVAVGQCDLQAVELCKKRFGGNLRVAENRGRNRRAVCYWSTTDKNAVRVLQELLPYLRIKKRQAELALELRALKERGRKMNGVLDEAPTMVNSRWGPQPRRWWRTKPEVLEEYRRLMTEVRLLNDSRHPLRHGRGIEKVPG